jgi:energy-coupling factor transporter ATP-binding protein EcfA2
LSLEPSVLEGEVASPGSGGAGVEAVYRQRLQRFGDELRRVADARDRIANLRLLLFVGALACAGWAVWRREPLLVIPALLLLGGFAAAVRRHSRLAREARRLEALRRLNAEALARLGREWDRLPARGARGADAEHPYAADLDIFGQASLRRLLGRAATPRGEETLDRWLLGAASPRVVGERQRAVAELAPQLDLRQELELRAASMGDPRPNPEPFLEWAGGEPWLRQRSRWLWAGRASVACLWGLILAQWTGLVGPPYWVAFLMLNLALSASVGSAVYRVLSRVQSQEGAFQHYAGMFALLSETPTHAPLLARLREELRTGGLTAQDQARRLHRLAGLVYPRGAGLYLPLQALTLWDFELLRALEVWQAEAGERARGWLETLGEAEALASLAGLAHDQPEWAFPEVTPEATSVEAGALGHPLLPDRARAPNDVQVGPPGTFLLVTGSNMSGKSTLLRAIGVNLTLAQAGAPVCATSLRMPPARLWTSMRVQDSLEQGVSYFMAELQRLKRVVDASREASSQGGATLVYLLDEILQGTNTFERQAAARRVIAYLVAQGALGAVSTHDLTLAGEEPLASLARAVHFTESVREAGDGPVMTFDYKLRPGIAVTTNALRLMELVGLLLPEPGGTAHDRGAQGRDSLGA